jgi:hypothetical protein
LVKGFKKEVSIMISIVLGVGWMVMGFVFMITGMDFDMIFKAFLLAGVFFISVNVQFLRTELKNNVRLILREGDLKGLKEVEK